MNGEKRQEDQNIRHESITDNNVTETIKGKKYSHSKLDSHSKKKQSKNNSQKQKITSQVEQQKQRKAKRPKQCKRDKMTLILKLIR